ncbi:hypothetical protein ABW48_03645 [Pluralibacter gergoviae]|nr:hypothetical protein ABW48_03645 [Pluralibacter gergoviae]
MAYLLTCRAIELPATAGGVVEERNAARSLCTDFGGKDKSPSWKGSAGSRFGVSVKTQNHRRTVGIALRGCEKEPCKFGVSLGML